MEIRRYLEDVVSRNDLEKYIKLQHELLAAYWEGGTSNWRMKIRANGTNETEDTADVLVLATGILNRWQWPCIEGLSDFQGMLLHSANWKGEPEEWEDKTVGVIGAVCLIYIPPSLSDNLCNLPFLILGLLSHTNCSRSSTESETDHQLCPFEDMALSFLGISPLERIHWEGSDGH